MRIISYGNYKAFGNPKGKWIFINLGRWQKVISF